VIPAPPSKTDLIEGRQDKAPTDEKQFIIGGPHILMRCLLYRAARTILWFQMAVDFERLRQEEPQRITRCVP
jgi:hypothetical protein